MLNIKDQVFITLKIDDKEIEYGDIKSITLCEGNGVFAPTLKIELDDPSSFLAREHALSEGNTIEILIAKSMDDGNAEPRKYRVFGPTRENPSYNPNVCIIGILDCPNYFTASARECTNGTSDDAIRAIADKCGLKYVGPSKGRKPNDKMIWLDVCTTRAQNVYEITRRGWIDDKSCMESMVTSHKELRYKNIVDEMNTPPGQIKFLFVHSTLEDQSTGTGKKVYIAKEARDKSSGGAMSSWVNYGSTRCANHINGVQRDREKVNVPTPGAYVAINKDVSDMVKRTRFDYGPIDCTNTHQQYQNAWYQNLKIMALFTETMSLLTLDVTDIELFDMIIYRQADCDPSTKVRNEDIYMVVGKTIVCRGGIHYAERLQCARMSLTMKGQTDLKSSLDGGGGGDNLVPESSIDMSGSGMGSFTLPNIRKITGGLTGVGGINSAISGITSLIPQSVTQTFQQLTSLYSVLSSGNATQITSALGTMVSPLGSVLQQTQQIQSQVSQLPGLTNGMVSNLPQSSGYSNNTNYQNSPVLASQLAQAVFSKPGSLLSTLAQSVVASLLFGNLSAQTTNATSAAPGQCMLSPDGQSVIDTNDSLSSSLYGISRDTSSTWNTMLATTSGQSIPQQYHPQTPQNQQTTVQNGFLSRLMVQVLITGMDQPSLERFLTQEFSRTPAGTQNWMAPNELVPQKNSTMDMATLNRLISNLG